MTLADTAKLTAGLIGLASLLLGASWLISRWPRSRLPLLAVPCTLGAVFAYSALAARHGYAAAYDFVGAWAIAIGLVITGTVLVLIRRVRRAGVAGIVAGVALLMMFYGVYLTGYGLGLHAWKHKVTVPIPPTAPR